jgi:dephospho-CoA kinase
VGTMLQSLGAGLIDADAISRACTAAGGSAIATIAEQFGPAFINATGALDRARMRELVFAKPKARAQLEAIIHPLVGQGIEQALQACVSRVAVLDIPLLAESDRWRHQLDAVLVVDCDEATQVERVQARSGWAEQAVRSAMASQASRAQRLACADAVLFNQGLALHALRTEVGAWAQHFGL